MHILHHHVCHGIPETNEGSHFSNAKVAQIGDSMCHGKTFIEFQRGLP